MMHAYDMCILYAVRDAPYARCTPRRDARLGEMHAWERCAPGRDAHP